MGTCRFQPSIWGAAENAISRTGKETRGIEAERGTGMPFGRMVWNGCGKPIRRNDLGGCERCKRTVRPWPSAQRSNQIDVHHPRRHRQLPDRHSHRARCGAAACLFDKVDCGIRRFRHFAARGALSLNTRDRARPKCENTPSATDPAPQIPPPGLQHFHPR